MWSQMLTVVVLCVFSFYSGVGDVKVDVIKKILADNKQVKSMRSSQGEFCLSVAPKLHSAPAGEHYRLVQTTQEHGTADDVQRKAGPWEPEERPVQPSPDLPAADAQQRNTSRLNPQDGVCRLHLTQQVGISYSNACLFAIVLSSVKLCVDLDFTVCVHFDLGVLMFFMQMVHKCSCTGQ